jgi:hypothetical protein
VADRNGKLRIVRQPLQFHFPQTQARSIAAPAVRSDQQIICCWIKMPPLVPPPATDGRNGESASIVIRPKVYKARIAPQVVDTIGIRTRNIGMRKVVPLHLDGAFTRQPLLSRVCIVTHQLLLLCVHGDNRCSFRKCSLDLCVDVPKLCIPVRMIFSLLRFTVALQAVAQIVEKLRNFRVTDRMLLPNEPLGQNPGALAGPAQWRFRVATGLWVYQKFQRINQVGVMFGDFSAPCSKLAYSPRWRDLSSLNLLDAFSDCLARQATRPAYARNTTVSKRTGLVGGQKPPCPLVQKRPHTGKLFLKSNGWFHTSLHYTPLSQFATFIYLHVLTVLLGTDIKDNEWEINPNNYFKRTYSELGLEVTDNFNLPILQVKVIDENTVALHGVFISKTTVVVATESGVSVMSGLPSLDRIRNELQNLPRLFQEKPK